jgi:metal-dependent HD superfamily phosphatase/phosphodiesterase
MKSGKEISLDTRLIETVDSFKLSGKAAAVLKLLLKDEEIQASQEYANTVSIVRLGYNDHGPVHMRTVTLTALKMLRLLREAGIKTSMEKDECGDFEDSLSAVICASILHDLGMGMGRQDHDLYGIFLAYPILDRILAEVYRDNLKKRVIIRALALEGITGHMGTRTVYSLEAGMVQIADGCDMTKGRARIPLLLWQDSSKGGHIHQYSANSIEEVLLNAGKEKPIRIDVRMSNESGFFQVEEVLLKKIGGSPTKPFVELYAQVKDEAPKQYL